MNPTHYQGKVEPIDLIDAHNLGFYEANIVKYITRWKKKNGLEDLKKAKWYLDRLIALNQEKILDPNPSTNIQTYHDNMEEKLKPKQEE
jgi:hypothetical protein